MKVKIYRVEDLDGNGPYARGNRDKASANFTRHLLESSDCAVTHPTIGEEGYYAPPWSWRYGFASLEQARAWFSRLFMEFLEWHGPLPDGWGVSVYTLKDPGDDNLLVTEKQAVFNRELATLQTRLPLHTLIRKEDVYAWCN